MKDGRSSYAPPKRFPLECDEIPEKDKEKIVTAKTVYSVAKGTIDSFSKYGDVSEVMDAVKPVVSLKNVEIIKG